MAVTPHEFAYNIFSDSKRFELDEHSMYTLDVFIITFQFIQSCEVQPAPVAKDDRPDPDEVEKRPWRMRAAKAAEAAKARQKSMNADQVPAQPCVICPSTAAPAVGGAATDSHREWSSQSKLKRQATLRMLDELSHDTDRVRRRSVDKKLEDERAGADDVSFRVKLEQTDDELNTLAGALSTVDARMQRMREYNERLLAPASSPSSSSATPSAKVADTSSSKGKTAKRVRSSVLPNDVRPAPDAVVAPKRRPYPQVTTDPYML